MSVTAVDTRIGEQANLPQAGTPAIARVVAGMPRSGIREFFDLVLTMDDVLSLGVGEPDFVTPWRVREAGIYAIERGHTAYTSNHGLLSLRRGVAEYLQSRFGVAYNPETEVFITVGVSQGIDLAMRALLDPGDEALIVQPCYVSYVPMAELTYAKAVIVETYAKDNFALDFDRLEAAVTPKTKILMINYPSNPTGATYTREQLEKLAQFCCRHNIVVFSDEVYAELTYEGDHVALATMPGMWERTIFLSGFSKAFAMTGWRMGYAAGPKDYIDAMVKIHQYSMLSAPTISQEAALEAVRHGDEDVRRMVDSYHERRNFFVRGLNEVGLKCHMPAGAFYAFPSIEGTGMTEVEFCKSLLAQEKVAIVPGAAFGECGRGHVRCSYATSIEKLESAVERIGRFVERARRG
jgi:aminotransferase